MASKNRRRHTPDQIIRKIAEGNKLLASGQELDAVLKELEAENARLKKLVANQALDIDMLREISAGNF